MEIFLFHQWMIRSYHHCLNWKGPSLAAGRMPSMDLEVLLDSGMLIGALMKGDSRHFEARIIIEQARAGEINASITVGILCEVYAALTWEGATPRHPPEVAADAVMAIVNAPSKIRVLPETEPVLSRMLELARKYRLHARRIHDARHAATALTHGVVGVMTYDIADWKLFDSDGMKIVGPTSVLSV